MPGLFLQTTVFRDFNMINIYGSVRSQNFIMHIKYFKNYF